MKKLHNVRQKYEKLKHQYNVFNVKYSTDSLQVNKI